MLFTVLHLEPVDKILNNAEKYWTELSITSCTMTIQKKALKQYFFVVLFCLIIQQMFLKDIWRTVQIFDLKEAAQYHKEIYAILPLVLEDHNLAPCRQRPS